VSAWITFSFPTKDRDLVLSGLTRSLGPTSRYRARDRPESVEAHVRIGCQNVCAIPHHKVQPV